MEEANNRQSSRWMTKRYAVALTVIALLAGLAYAALTMVIAEQESTGAVVNISGRQRMLSQRTTLFVQRMLLAQNPKEYADFSGELTKATDLIEFSHRGLTQGSAELGLPAEMSDTVREMYFGGEAPLDPRMKTFVAALRTVLAQDYGDLRPDLPEVKYILSTAPGPLLKSLDRMVWQYQREGEAVILMLHRLEAAVLGLTLFTLMLEVLLIFRPMVRQVGAQITHILHISDKLGREVGERKRAEDLLRKAHDELEVRVEERTAELTEEIEQRKRIEGSLRKSEQRFRSVAETANDAIITIDGKGHIVTWNKGAETVFGYEEGEALGRSMEKMMPEDYRARHAAGIARMEDVADSGVLNHILELHGLHKDGRVFPLELSIAAWSTDSDRFFTGIIRDISERKRIEDELHAALEDLKHSNAELRQFAYVASHDLQEPLRMVTSYMQLLERQMKGKLDDENLEYFGYAVEGAKRMGQLIKDLLDYSRVESRGEEFVPVDAGESLCKALLNLQVAVSDAEAKITHDDMPLVLADDSQLMRLIQNIIGNALKYHAPDRPPEIHVSAERHGGEWRFSVRDNGIGIEPQYFDRVFDIFQRLHGRNEYEGTGIGLAICRKIVERHGGSIWLESEPGEGSTFFFSLPAAD